MPAWLKALRPKQWVKNLFVLAPLVFARALDEEESVERALLAFALFSMVASAIYLMNDLSDVEADRAHPQKRHRPIASGALSPARARAMMSGLALAAIGGAFFLGWQVALVIGGYLLLQIVYTFKLKRVPYVDVLCIAAGFELRVLAGTFAIEVLPSIYLLVVTLLLSLFLGFGKRMHELQQGKHAAEKQRSVLSHYSIQSVSRLLQLTALATTGTYVVYTLDPDTRATFGTDYLAATIVFAEFGVIRFMELVQRSHDAESPTDQMLRDWPFLVNLVLWAIAVVGVIYFS